MNSIFTDFISQGRAERFAKPKPVTKWEGLYNATEWQFACPQHTVPFSETVKHVTALKAVSANEDCLFVNVYRPAKEATKPRAVMVWVHGGAFTEGNIKTKPLTFDLKTVDF